MRGLGVSLSPSSAQADAGGRLLFTSMQGTELSGRAGGEANVTDQHEKLPAKVFLGDGGVAPPPWELPAAA